MLNLVVLSDEISENVGHMGEIDDDTVETHLTTTSLKRPPHLRIDKGSRCILRCTHIISITLMLFVL